MIFLNLKTMTFSSFFAILFLIFQLVLVEIKPVYAITKASVVAVVDGIAISSIDLQNKIKLLLLTIGKKENTENISQYRQQALDMLIDETLKTQAGISANPSALENALKTAPSFFEDIYGSKNLTGAERLQSAGIQVSTALDQISSDVIWTGVLTTKFKRQFSQVDLLANAERERLLSNLSAPQYKISEIVLMPIPSRPLDQTQKLAQQLVRAINQGADFNAIAAQYSMSGSSKNGGKIGWVQAQRLPTDIQVAIENARFKNMKLISVKSNEFFYIFRLEGYRELGFNDPVLDKVSIARAIIKLPSNLSDIAIKKQVSNLTSESKKFVTCKDLVEFHQATGSNVSSQINNVVIEQLEGSFRETVLELDVQKVSDVFHTANNELIVFMVCGRTKVEPDIPPLEKLKEAEFNKLYSVLSLRYLMRLRRAASIEIKIK